MRKIILILSLILLTNVSVDAQNRRREPRKQIDRTERQEMRVQRMTDMMASTYNLSADQKAQLKDLNTKWLSRNLFNRQNKSVNKKQNRRYPCFTNDSTCLGTPTLYKEVRMKQLEKEITEYRSELKRILTDKQYKEYERKIQEGVKQAEAR